MRQPILAAACILLAATACPADLVRTATAKYSGKVVHISPLEVTVALPITTEKIPANQIEVIEYDNEPTYLRIARSHIAAGRYEEAQTALQQKIQADTIGRAEIRQEVEFYKALVATQLALQGKMEVRQAGTLASEFLRTYPQSYRYFRANELVGDLLVAHGQFAKAREYYGRVAEAPWPESKMRAQVAIGRVFLEEGKPQEALKSFESVLAMKAEDPAARAQHLAATLGKARALAETGQTEQAIELANQIIAKAKADDIELLARAYNVLGVALQRAARLREALFAFLHVETLYAAAGEPHAEALYHLVEVWRDLKRLDRAQETRQALKEQYPGTRWAKALAGP